MDHKLIVKSGPAKRIFTIMVRKITFKLQGGELLCFVSLCFGRDKTALFLLPLPPSLSSTGVSCLLKSSAVLDPTERELQQLNTLCLASIFMAAVCCNLSHKWGPTVARKSHLVRSPSVRMCVFKAGIQAIVFIFQKYFLSRTHKN